jgi:8-oxo-dGTP diphosphatase
VEADEEAQIDVRHGVVIVAARGQQYLVIRRAEGILAGGAWCFVGGGIDAGETQESAVMREFREEVGGQVRPIRKVWEYIRADGRLHLHWWLVELLEDALHPNPHEVAELRWCTAAEILELPNLLESNRQFLAEFDRGGLKTSG